MQLEEKAKELINYIKQLGVEVHTTTKARGNQGFYVKNRIDISKNITQERIIPTLIHEFTHYIHSQIEPFMCKTGGTIECIFDDDNPNFYRNELIAVTEFVDKNSKFEILKAHKQQIKSQIKVYEDIIKRTYPEFMRSKNFAEFNNYIRHSKAKYLLKYDRVKLISGGVCTTTENYSIDNIEKDFSDMPSEFAAYIRLRSSQKKQSRICSKINRLNKYYTKPSELFARFVEGLYINSEYVKQVAPNSYRRFRELLSVGYYRELAGIFSEFDHEDKHHNNFE